MKKRVLSAVLVFAICLTLSVPAFAATFSDLKGHWAEKYMEDLADRKFLSGYGDGTMKPDSTITACETLALLSRFYSPSETELSLINADYEAYAISVVPTTMKWAYDEVTLCLAAGIITKDELKALDLSKAIEKQLLSVFLVRAMQKQSDAAALSTEKLTFADAADVSSGCVGSVAELYKLGIVKGDDSNKFSPKSGVSRAVVATMVSRSLDYLDNNSVKLTISDYVGLSRTSGIITAAGSGSVELRGTDGLVREYKFTTAADVTVGGKVKTLSSSYVGYSAVVSKQNGAVTAVAVADSGESWVQGIVSSVSTASSNNYLYIYDTDTGRMVNYTIPAAAVITRYDKETNFASISKNDFVTIKKTGNTITALTAENADRELKGEITEIKFGATITLKIMDSEGVSFVFGFEIADPPKILRGSTAISVDRLSVGNAVVLTVDDAKVTTITTEGSESSITGQLTSITSTTGGTQWVIATDTGSVTLTLDRNAGVYSGSTPILLSDIQAGDTVTVQYYGSTITDIFLVTSTNSSTKLTGTVLAVDTSKRIITVLTTTEKIVYISTSSLSSMLLAATGSSISLSSLTVNSQLLAYGSYSDSATFVAKSIVVEVYQPK